MDYNRSNLQIKHTLALSSHLVGMLAWQKVCVQQRMEAAARRVYVCARPHLGIYMFFCVCLCVHESARVCVFGHAQQYLHFLSWKKDRQPGLQLQDRRGRRGCSHMLCPDKAHLFGLGLPLPPSLHIGAASFSASGLSQLRWVSALQNAH